MGHLPLGSYYYYPCHRHIVQIDLSSTAVGANLLVRIRFERGRGPGSVAATGHCEERNSKLPVGHALVGEAPFEGERTRSANESGLEGLLL